MQLKTNKHRTTLAGMAALCAIILLLPTTVSAAPLYPYWITPAGTSGAPSNNPLPPPGPSAGLTVTLNKGASLLANTAASDAFDLAAQYAASWIADPIDMVINVDLGSLGGGLGSSNPIQVGLSYDTTRTQLAADQVNHVGAGDITDFLPNVVNASNLNTVLPAGITVNDTISLTRANAKALGANPAFLPGGVNGSDGAITLDDTGFAWDYDPTDGITAGMFDFFGVALHEIGHIMGFISAVDLVDSLVNGNQTGSVSLTTLDLFRLAPGAGCTDFTGSARQISPNTDAATYLGECTDGLMSTGALTGDGNTAAHWKDNLGIGMMDPTFATGESAIPSQSDLRVFDLIGWDAVPPTAAVPVPASIWLLASGLGLFGFGAKRRRG